MVIVTVSITIMAIITRTRRIVIVTNDVVPGLPCNSGTQINFEKISVDLFPHALHARPIISHPQKMLKDSLQRPLTSTRNSEQVWRKSCTKLPNPNIGNYTILGILHGARFPPLSSTLLLKQLACLEGLARGSCCYKVGSQHLQHKAFDLLPRAYQEGPSDRNGP